MGKAGVQWCQVLTGKWGKERGDNGTVREGLPVKVAPEQAEGGEQRHTCGQSAVSAGQSQIQ